MTDGGGRDGGRSHGPGGSLECEHVPDNLSRHFCHRAGALSGR